MAEAAVLLKEFIAEDEEIIRVRERVEEIVLAHEYIRQMHGFYLLREQKAMRFDLVVGFEAKDRRAAFEAAVADVRAAFPDYTLQTAMDTDFT